MVSIIIWFHCLVIKSNCILNYNDVYKLILIIILRITSGLFTNTLVVFNGAHYVLTAFNNIIPQSFIHFNNLHNLVLISICFLKASRQTSAHRAMQDRLTESLKRKFDAATICEDNYVMVASIDFGTTYSGYAFSFKTQQDEIRMNKNWGDGVGHQSFKVGFIVFQFFGGGDTLYE